MSQGERESECAFADTFDVSYAGPLPSMYQPEELMRPTEAVAHVHNGVLRPFTCDVASCYYSFLSVLSFPLVLSDSAR